MSESKPITNMPATLGEALDKRRTVEDRIARKYVESAASAWDDGPSTDGTFRFWMKGAGKLDNAKSLVQQVLDRYSVLTELNETSGAVTCLKSTNVVVPAFVPSMKETTLTLAQLRDSVTWLTPHLKKLETHLTSQATQTSNHCSSHNTRVRASFDAKVVELKRAHEAKVKTATEFKEENIPTDKDLADEIDRERLRSDTRLGSLVDPVGIRSLISKLRDFIKLMDEERDIRIDAANSTGTDSEIAELYSRRRAFLKSPGAAVKATSPPDGHVSLSLAELDLRLKSLSEATLNAIPHLRVVTLVLSHGGKHEHDVSNADTHLAEVFHNISALMSYRQSHHEAMTLTFTTTHPLTHQPLSVDGLVRLGYIEDTAPAYGSRRRKSSSVGPKITLRHGLDELCKALSTTGSEVADSKACHATAVKESISAKQEARAKSGAAMRSSELEDIATSVMKTEASEWTVAPGLDEALEQVTKLCAQVESLQSAGRKSANAVIRVNVPEPSLLAWVQPKDTLAGWA